MKLVHRAQREWGVGLVVAVDEEGRRLGVRFAGREGVTVVSDRDPALQAVAAETPLDRPTGGLLESLASADPGKASAFRLRSRVVRLEALRRADSLGALLSSRVHVLPHQVGAAGRILADRAPRFVLADEVGLGKTIEAGLVFAGLRQLGIAERVLVAVPDHLSFQWLAELFHKFNALFTLLTPERIGELGGPAEALDRSPHAIVSHEQLVADPDLARAAAERPADLLVVDEAHHLAEDPLFAAVEPSARASFGLLLLTATPVRLDPREYHRLLSLVEPVPSASLEAFLARLEAHEAYAEVARGLLGGAPPAAALDRLRSLAPDDPVFRGSPSGEALLEHLAARYSLSARLIRNRRARVGAFTRRVLRRADLQPGEKRRAAAELCARLARAGEKALVFGSDLAALRELQAEIAERERIEALLYDDAPTLEARDRLVARFRDPDGPMILLSGESGGEGRNFQFAAHLVNYDLPDSPLALEQRIGRLDRLGQTRPVEIHVLAGTGEEAFLADLYDQVVGIFDEPVGGLDAVLASLPAELEALRRSGSEEARAAFREELSRRVAAGRRAQREGYDPLLDLRSASLPELTALVRGAFERLGEEPPSAGDGPADDLASVQQGLQTLSRWLEEELEDLSAEVGQRVGIEVDADENVHPFEVAFTLGREMRIEALPGMAVPEEPRTHLGSFWRETAVAQDELEWFATGHRLVEALLGLARDGAAGRTAALRFSGAPRRGGLYLRQTVRWPAPADLEPGARVPSRQAARYLDASPVAVLVDLGPSGRARAVSPEVEEALQSAEDARVAPPPAALLEAAREAGRREAERILEERRAEALARLAAHARAEEERLCSAGAQGAVPAGAVERALAVLRAHRAATEEALRQVSLEEDAAALVLP
jgi:ATP-dependent helicase HepA